VRGFVHETDDAQSIKERAKGIAGDLPLEFDIQYQMLPRFGHFDFR